MNALAVFVVNEHLEFLLAEAAQRRAQRTEKPSLRRRIASVATSLRGALSAPAASLPSPTAD